MVLSQLLGILVLEAIREVSDAGKGQPVCASMGPLGGIYRVICSSLVACAGLGGGLL